MTQSNTLQKGAWDWDPWSHGSVGFHLQAIQRCTDSLPVLQFCGFDKAESPGPQSFAARVHVI